VECIVERDYQPSQINEELFPEIHTKVVNDGFQLGAEPQTPLGGASAASVRRFTILDFCDNAVLREGDTPVNFNIDNVLDITINELKHTITRVLYILPVILDTYTKKEIFELYACASVREDPAYWGQIIGDKITGMMEYPSEDIIIVRD
jgi:hypothetical protein